MKKVALEISNLCDIDPIKLRGNKIALYVMMTDKQITRNIWALTESKVEPQELLKLKAVK